MEKQHIYTVVELTSSYWEDTHSRTVYTCMDADEAIAFAKNFYITNENELICHNDFANVVVDELPVGVVENVNRIWQASKDLEFMSKAQLEAEIVVKPSLSILWDNEVPVEQNGAVNLKHFGEYQQFVAGSEAVKHHVLNQKAVIANDMAWDLFDRFEKAS